MRSLIALATFLIAAGAGSLWTSRVPHSSPTQRYVVLAVAGIVGLGALLSFTFDPLLARLEHWGLASRIAVSAALIAPLAFFMGFPFPLALRRLDAPLVPWAWGINGCASVVSPMLATLLAVDLGFTAVLWLALAGYAIMPALLPSPPG